MPFFVNVKQRHREPEVMDQPDLDAAKHHDALRGLARLNWWSRSAGLLWPAIREAALASGGRPLRVLDVATGGGDLPSALFRKARRAGLSIEFAGCDVSDQALKFAEARARHRGARLTLQRVDVLRDALPEGYDVLTCSLFLHHLSEEDAVGLLGRMATAARQMVIVNDLVRTRLTYLIVYAASHVLSRSPVVHTDGPLSVRAAFTLEEARALAEKAGLANVDIRSRFPARFLMTWRRPVEEVAR